MINTRKINTGGSDMVGGDGKTRPKPDKKKDVAPRVGGDGKTRPKPKKDDDK